MKDRMPLSSGGGGGGGCGGEAAHIVNYLKKLLMITALCRRQNPSLHHPGRKDKYPPFAPTTFYQSLHAKPHSLFKYTLVQTYLLDRNHAFSCLPTDASREVKL